MDREKFVPEHDTEPQDVGREAQTKQEQDWVSFESC